MKILIYLIALIPLFLLFFSCSEEKDFQEVNTPTFKVVSFEKVLVDGVYNCKATIVVAGLTDKYSIDGIIYADDITKCWGNIPYNEDISTDIHPEGEGKFYFNLFGNHSGDFTIMLEWTSTTDRTNYLVGWHLNYGFGANCQVLLVDLNTSIIQ